ncbi:MAG: hypothetical protein ABIK73_09195 [candidate division WOR-3 bacterium]
MHEKLHSLESQNKNEQDLLEFITAIFQDTDLYENSVEVKGYLITFKLPSYSDMREVEKLLADAVINKTTKTKKEFLSLKSLYRIAITLKSISKDGKIIFENKIGSVQNRANILSSFIRTDVLFKLLSRLSLKFEKKIKEYLAEVTSKDFF